MKTHLTDSAIARLKTPVDRVEYKDTRIPGFTLRVGRRAKVWYFRSTVQRERVSIKLGTWPIVNAEMARARCIHWLQQNRDTYVITPNAQTGFVAQISRRSNYPNPQTDLSHADRLRRAQCCEAI